MAKGNLTFNGRTNDNKLQKQKREVVGINNNSCLLVNNNKKKPNLCIINCYDASPLFCCLFDI